MTLDHAPCKTHSAFPRIAPFALFMLFIAVEEGLRFLDAKTGIGIPYTFFLFLYPVKTVVVGGTLLYFRNCYDELKWLDLRLVAESALSVGLGIAVFFFWINMIWPWAVSGTLKGFDPSIVSENFTRFFLIFFRVLGASLVVPVMEELFWRSWLLRYLVSPNFHAVELGRFTISSFVIGSVLFGLEHNLWLAGIMAGAAYSLILYRTRSIAQCILAHSVTNLLLGIYVLNTGKWYFW